MRSAAVCESSCSSHSQRSIPVCDPSCAASCGLWSVPVSGPLLYPARSARRLRPPAYTKSEPDPTHTIISVCRIRSAETSDLHLLSARHLRSAAPPEVLDPACSLRPDLRSASRSATCGLRPGSIRSDLRRYFSAFFRRAKIRIAASISASTATPANSIMFMLSPVSGFGSVFSIGNSSTMNCQSSAPMLS